ncbi:FAD dependent oxidoreductase [Hypoxylon sp. NC1633]|nr:FAD dependent oxidoreductase [Hypoxylon sp. NC1633]
MAPITPSSKIIIVGSGVFGITTALWLAESGYEDVTVLDMQDTAVTAYDPLAGVDSASADLNKIIRFSYGSEIEYQRLATEAAQIWHKWNLEIAAAPSDELSEALRGDGRRLWWNAGMLRMSCEPELGDFELETLENMKEEGLREFQFRSDDDAGWAHKLDPCRRQERFGTHKAVLDSTAGFVYAFKSCAWAQHLARKAGVKMILDPVRGKVLDIASTGKRPVVHTADGQEHPAELVVVAGEYLAVETAVPNTRALVDDQYLIAGGWTPSLVPEVSDLLETTAGSVATVLIPRDRPDLWERFAPENQPVISWGSRQGKDVYSIPRDEKGAFKIGWRKTKWTNFEEIQGKRISVPKTAHVTEQKETRIPLDALDEFISINFPELAPLGISSTRLCWYTDSIDNSFVVDFVLGRPGIAVCSGGSGHGFKFLPILGREVTKILEGKGSQTVYGQMWRWRSSDESRKNGLEEGEHGPRVLSKQKMASEADWKFTG